MIRGCAVADPFTYDNDNLLTQAGSLTITRNTQNGLLTATSLSTTTTSQAYNLFGEVNQFSATQGTTALHTFSYSPVDLEERYTPPAVAGVSTPQTQYAYNLDKQLTTITRPDGQTVSLNYDSAGRLSNVTTPNRTVIYG